MTKMVALGTIVNTPGIRGELRLLPYNPDTTALQPGHDVFLARGEMRLSPWVVESPLGEGGRAGRR